MKDKALLHFRYPSDEMLVALRELIGRLEICSPEKFVPPYLIEGDAFRGDLDAVGAQLAEQLRLDFAENEAHCDEWNGSFDYVVARSFLVEEALDVQTRLYTTVPNSNKGDIYYSRVIERVGTDSYLYWGANAEPED